MGRPSVVQDIAVNVGETLAYLYHRNPAVLVIKLLLYPLGDVDFHATNCIYKLEDGKRLTHRFSDSSSTAAARRGLWLLRSTGNQGTKNRLEAVGGAMGSSYFSFGPLWRECDPSAIYM